MTDNALYQLGMDLAEPGTAQTENFVAITDGEVFDYDPGEAKDHFVVKNGVECAGTHLIIDLIGASWLDDIKLIEKTLRQCVTVAGATLLHLHLHHFTPNAGVSGVAVLAESHISIHTWPERDYAALDVFMCGDAKPELCIDVLREAFAADKVVVGEHLRGQGA
ncbi:MAG: adenosylmethionine decarboxylase [Rhizobiales bacterium]|nr:adenosylmethionine decarboxylase [Hyphomicrobiales bacterium]